jgi:hypothetical protein
MRVYLDSRTISIYLLWLFKPIFGLFFYSYLCTYDAFDAGSIHYEGKWGGGGGLGPGNRDFFWAL